MSNAYRYVIRRHDGENGGHDDRMVGCPTRYAHTACNLLQAIADAHADNGDAVTGSGFVRYVTTSDGAVFSYRVWQL